ncbi:MAG: transglutaminase-like domain-containing protein [Bacteroidota bacterium]
MTKAVVTKGEATNIHTWQLQNLMVVGREPNTPDSYRSLPVLRTLPNDFKVDGYVGNMETWESFGRFMYELNKNRDKLSPQMFQKVQTLTANAKNNAEKIAILYQYLQENMRYVSVQLGIGGWQTFDANYVEQNKYGDCKALTNFMKGMLKAVGIKAYASLVVAGDQRLEIKDDFTTPYFNHVILNVPDENIWLECTSTNNPVNYLGANTEDRPTLLITEKGGVLTKTPKIDQNQQTGETTISLTNEGAATINCNTQLTGKLHESYRYIVHNYSPDKQQKWFVRNQDFPTFQTKKLDLSVSKTAPEANCNYTIQVNRYASKAGKRLFVPLNLVNKFGRSLPKAANRTQPIAFELGYEDTDEKMQRLLSEQKAFLDRWQEFIEQGDPYYNPNLSLKNERFSLRFRD